jgi:hypothetical protein
MDQSVRTPVRAMTGHDVCADVHTALFVAHAVLTSRDERVADLTESDLNATLLRELRAAGVTEAAPYLIAMVAVLDAAMDRLVGVTSVDRAQAWQQISDDVLRKHCSDPDNQN